MSHKVHPKIYRLRDLKDWSSRWLDKKKFLQYLEEDFIIRQYLKKKIGKLSIERVEIERFPNKVIVIIFSARPGLIIGRGGTGIEELKKELEKEIFKKIIHPPKFSSSAKISKGNLGEQERKLRRASQELKLEVKEIKNPWTSAALSAQWIAQQIEKRVHHKRALKWALEKIMILRENKGARVEVSGRLGGSEIARREWLSQGGLPRQTIRADIDYGEEKAFCSYGVIGVKVWIYKGERFD